MTKSLEDAIAAAGSDMFAVPEAHRTAVPEGVEQAEGGEFVGDKEIEALWKKCGL